jgi:hypothetical protein
VERSGASARGKEARPVTWGFASANRSFIVSEFLPRTSVTCPNGQRNPATGRDQRGLRIELARLGEQDASLFGRVANPLQGVAASGSLRRVGRRGSRGLRRATRFGGSGDAASSANGGRRSSEHRESDARGREPDALRSFGPPTSPGKGTSCSSELRAPHLRDRDSTTLRTNGNPIPRDWETDLLAGTALGSGTQGSLAWRHGPIIGARRAARFGGSGGASRGTTAREALRSVARRPHRDREPRTLRSTERPIPRGTGTLRTNGSRETGDRPPRRHGAVSQVAVYRPLGARWDGDRGRNAGVRLSPRRGVVGKTTGFGRMWSRAGR